MFRLIVIVKSEEDMQKLSFETLVTAELILTPLAGGGFKLLKSRYLIEPEITAEAAKSYIQDLLMHPFSEDLE